MTALSRSRPDFLVQSLQWGAEPVFLFGDCESTVLQRHFFFPRLVGRSTELFSLSFSCRSRFFRFIVCNAPIRAVKKGRRDVATIIQNIGRPPCLHLSRRQDRSRHGADPPSVTPSAQEPVRLRAGNRRALVLSFQSHAESADLRPKSCVSSRRAPQRAHLMKEFRPGHPPEGEAQS